MIKQGLWQPKKKKQSEHREWRQRKSFFGEMEQFDGSYEFWLEDRGPYCCLQVAVDDAKGEITHGRFDSDEGVFPTFAFWQEYLRKNGKPANIYLDQFSTYKMTQKVAQDNHDAKTQFQRAMTELNIRLITAYSPQAKGRVERIFGTLQDRLIKEMRLRNISTIEQANLFLRVFTSYATFFPLELPFLAFLILWKWKFVFDIIKYSQCPSYKKPKRERYTQR